LRAFDAGSVVFGSRGDVNGLVREQTSLDVLLDEFALDDLQDAPAAVVDALFIVIVVIVVIVFNFVEKCSKEGETAALI